MQDWKTLPRITVLSLLMLCCTENLQTQAVQSEGHRFKVETVSADLRHPWGVAFLPGGELLVTERPGRLLLVEGEGSPARRISGLPEIREHGQGGLLGIALHPDFEVNRWVYLSHAGEERGMYGTEVIRGRLEGTRLQDVKTLFKALPKSGSGRHFGSRLVFAPDGTLFISLGDRGERPAAQNLDDHRGSLIRINDDGSIPEDNPFGGRAGLRPEIYSYGHRNIQGMVLNPFSGDIWAHEHGPQGGDEINVIKPGTNYGWPVITYGVNYGIGTKIGEGTHQTGMAQPIQKWIPSIAPSGMAFYTGDQFPNWKGDLFVGSLKFELLVSLELEGDRIVGEERMLQGEYGRIRDVVQGPDGYLYLLTDEEKGRLLRLTPVF